MAVGFIRVQLPCERDTGAVGPDDDRSNMPLATHVLSLEREQTGLETDATTAEQDQQCRDRRHRHHRQSGVGGLGQDHQLDERQRGSAPDRDDDSRGFLDRGVLPDRSVQTSNAIDDQLRRDR